MCGRYTNQYTWAELHALYSLSDDMFPTSNHRPQYNIAPTQKALVVKLDKTGKRELVEMQWGLIPSWSKDGKPPGSTFNAKCETVAEKPAFRSAFKSRPCLVVSDNFYEWRKTGPKDKQPYVISRKEGKPFAFAGIWETWRAPDGKVLETFAIMTCPPNELCAPIHDRMPVILAPEEWDAWLSTPEARKKLCRPFPADDMVLWQVGKAVGNVRNDGPELIRPLEETDDKPRRN
jgi:putative SOS response-associated peptidase YedK